LEIIIGITFFRAAGRGKTLVSAVVHVDHTLSIERDITQGNTPASNGAATHFRGCCGTWRNDSLHSPALHNESDIQRGARFAHPQSTTLDEPSNRLFASI